MMVQVQRQHLQMTAIALFAINGLANFLEESPGGAILNIAIAAIAYKFPKAGVGLLGVSLLASGFKLNARPGKKSRDICLQKTFAISVFAASFFCFYRVVYPK